jgi:hypothetical protein
MEGEFCIAGRPVRPGHDALSRGDPHYENELTTDAGGLMVIVQ